MLNIMPEHAPVSMGAIRIGRIVPVASVAWVTVRLTSSGSSLSSHKTATLAGLCSNGNAVLKTRYRVHAREQRLLRVCSSIRLAELLTISRVALLMKQLTATFLASHNIR